MHHICSILLKMIWCLNLTCISSTAGPVRGIDFHKQQPLFVSGGDDYKIKASVLELALIPDTSTLIIACVHHIFVYTA